MTREEVLKEVKECVAMATTTSADKLTEDTIYGQDIPVNSLAQMSISAMLDTKFTKAPSFTDIAVLDGIRDTVDWIMEHNN